MAVEFEAVCGPKFMTFWDDVGDPLSTHLTYCLYRVSFQRYRPLNMPLSCEAGQKRWQFVGGRDTPDFGHAFSNYTYFRPFGRIWLSSVQRARRLADEERKKESIPVKYKSADIGPTMSGGLIIQNDLQLVSSSRKPVAEANAHLRNLSAVVPCLGPSVLLIPAQNRRGFVAVCWSLWSVVAGQCGVLRGRYAAAMRLIEG